MWEDINSEDMENVHTRTARDELRQHIQQWRCNGNGNGAGGLRPGPLPFPQFHVSS